MDLLKDKKMVAYLAGLIDGDGHITIVNRGKNAKNGYNIKLCIYNCKNKIAKFLIKNIGGKIRSNNINASHKKWRNCLEYSATDNRAINFIKALLPFLIIKKQQAITALKAAKLISNNNNRTMHRWYPELKLALYAKIKVLKEEINKLNIRGSAKQFKKTNIKKIPFNIKYLAGFCDADGSIMIIKMGKHLTAKITFTNTNKNIIDWISFYLGGNLYTKKRTNDKWNISYELSFPQEQAYSLSNKLKQHLMLKNNQAKLVIDFGVLNKKFSGGTLRWNPKLNTKHKAAKERLHKACVKLNKRGT